ncbi:hypothetical protein GCM10025870_31070 [Agromyces marinus]|uniref:Uncharacterized protein n=1 Tax=Agromyces marinus TaxID=1389020 RepID=A0ABM8H5D9_9MICO|nr:hypothetical protein [Agromyces marinus]BDZ56034.1 hypothetical protein GCM10025870_31070 [Agromyces marinus]
MIGVHHPGDSVLHRLPAPAKLGLLALALTVTAVAGTPAVLGVAGAVTVGLFALAGIPVRVAWRQVSPSSGYSRSRFPSSGSSPDGRPPRRWPGGS